jgi:sugar phosphate permease
VSGRESGLASGILNTSQQIGGAIGLAILTGLSTSAAARYLHLHGAPARLTQLSAEVHGFHVAFYVATGFMIGASVLATVLLRQPKQTAKGAETENAAVSMH